MDSLKTAVPLQHQPSRVGGQPFPREEVSVSGAEIQNFYREILGSESMDCALSSTVWWVEVGGRFLFFYVQDAGSPLSLGLAAF